MSAVEEALALQIALCDLPEPVREFRFHPVRRWRFDFCWPEYMIAVEAEGGKWVQGRHQRPDGFEKDCEKYNAAAALGWRVFRFTADMIDAGDAVDTLIEVFREEGRP